MVVPENIRNVPRPRNTVICPNRKPGPYQWAVRCRSGTRYIPGKGTQPINGPVVGHIIGGKFYPVDSGPLIAGEGDSEYYAPSTRAIQYGATALALTVVEDLVQDLASVFTPQQTYDIISIAILRCTNPGIKDCRLGGEYEKSLLSIRFPGATLSAGSREKLYKELGKNKDKRVEFFTRRIEAIKADDHVIIDGTLKNDNSTVNNVSANCGRGGKKGRKYLNILFAYDVKNGEPLCSKVYPGNFTDSNAYHDFVETNNITRGILITDKGFFPHKIADLLDANPDLHFFTPLKRNDSRITNNKMRDFKGSWVEGDTYILYKKAQIKGGRYLYSFYDGLKSFNEAKSYLSRLGKNNKYDFSKFLEKRDAFGTIVFESDLDMDPLTAYRTYKERWMVETLFDFYKNTLGLNETRVQNDYEVIGSDFVNYITTVIGCRMNAIIREANLPEKFSYRDLLRELRQVWRYDDAPEPIIGDKYWEHTNLKQFAILEALGLAKAPDDKQNTTSSKANDNDAEDDTPGDTPVSADGTCLQRTGLKQSEHESDHSDGKLGDSPIDLKQPEHEPDHSDGKSNDSPVDLKQPEHEPSHSDGKSGDPSEDTKQPEHEPDHSDGESGDPSEDTKQSEHEPDHPDGESGDSSEDLDKSKRGHGRSRKNPEQPPPDPNQPKRGRGRPRKNPEQPPPDPNQPKRGRGRPRKNPEQPITE